MGDRPTQCNQLNNCLAANCGMVGSSERLENCALVNCGEYFDSYELWLVYQQCAATYCVAPCS